MKATEAFAPSFLFADPDLRAYAILDGARRLGTPDRLEEAGVNHICLHAGELDPEVREVSPYVVELKLDEPLLKSLMKEDWGNSYMIFLTSPYGLAELRRHLRDVAYAEMPDGEVVLFRFYDPRGLDVFLRTADRDQLDQIMGDVIEQVFYEAGNGEQVMTLRRGASGPSLL